MKHKLLIIFFLTAGVSSMTAQVVVTLPQMNVSVAPGTIIEVPVDIGTITGMNVVAYQFTLTFDENILKPESPFIIATGTISGQAGMSVMPNAGIQNKLIVGAFGANPLQGNGTLLRLVFKVMAAQGSSPLTFSSFVFNAGNPQANITQGSFTNQYGATPLTIGLPQLALNQAPGTIIEVPISSGDLSGLNIYAYQFTIGFNNNIVIPEPPFYSTSGTLSNISGWSIMANPNNENQLIIGAFGSQPLAGSGVLIKLIFKIIPALGSCPLTFNSFVFNAGTPQVNLVNGSFSNQYSTLPPSELVVQNMNLLSGQNVLFEALETISVSDFTVGADASARFVSGEWIIFGSGTHILSGGQMQARIDSGIGSGIKHSTNNNVDHKSAGGLINNYYPQVFPARFSVYPNPVSSTFSIAASAVGDANFITGIYDMLGGCIFQGSFSGSHKIEIDLSGKPAGLYLVRIHSGNHTEVHKIVKH